MREMRDLIHLVLFSCFCTDVEIFWLYIYLELFPRLKDIPFLDTMKRIMQTMSIQFLQMLGLLIIFIFVFIMELSNDYSSIKY